MQQTAQVDVLQAEVRDTERSSEAARQRVLQHREGVEASGREISVAEGALAELGERFPWHLDTLRVIRERLAMLKEQRDDRRRCLRGAEEHLGRWEARVVSCRERLAAARGTRRLTGPMRPLSLVKDPIAEACERSQEIEVIAQPPRSATLPFGLPKVTPSAAPRRRTQITGPHRPLSPSSTAHPAVPPPPPGPMPPIHGGPARPPSLPTLRWDTGAGQIRSIDAGGGAFLEGDHELLLDVISGLRVTVEQLEEDNARLRQRIGTVESNHLYVLRRLREQETDLQHLRDGQSRLEVVSRHVSHVAPHAVAKPVEKKADTWDRFDEDEEQDDLLFEGWDDSTPTVQPSTSTLQAVRSPKTRPSQLRSALDTQHEDDPELVFDEQFDRDVSALIRLMGKYQVERLEMPGPKAN